MNRDLPDREAQEQREDRRPDSQTTIRDHIVGLVKPGDFLRSPKAEENVICN